MLGSAFAAAALAVGLATVPLTAAHADSCVSTVTVADVTITKSSPGMFDQIGAHWAQPCGNTSALWNADSESNGQTKGSWLFTDTAPDQTWPLPYGDNSYLGQYKAILDPSSGDYYFHVPFFYIRLGSRILVQGYRSGNYVHLRGYVSRFNWNLNNGYGAYQPSRGRAVNFYEHTGNGWKVVGVLPTGADGFTDYISVYSPSAHQWGDKVLASDTLAQARPRHNISR